MYPTSHAPLSSISKLASSSSSVFGTGRVPDVRTTAPIAATNNTIAISVIVDMRAVTAGKNALPTAIAMRTESREMTAYAEVTMKGLLPTRISPSSADNASQVSAITGRNRPRVAVISVLVPVSVDMSVEAAVEVAATSAPKTAAGVYLFRSPAMTSMSPARTPIKVPKVAFENASMAAADRIASAQLTVNLVLGVKLTPS
jgi:hypothetical protein